MPEESKEISPPKTVQAGSKNTEPAQEPSVCTPLMVSTYSNAPPTTDLTRESYRNHLILAEQKAQDDFDKTLIALAGGAMGISFVFIKDIIGKSHLVHIWLQIIAWICWALTLTFVLIGYMCSRQALRKAIKQSDDGTIYDQTPGGLCGPLTDWLTTASGISFIAGVVLMIIFVTLNFGR